MKDVNIVITDLDDTIWDWLQMWYNFFNPYLERISKETGLSLVLLKEKFKRLHQKYSTTEMSSAYKELGVIEEKFYPLFEKTESDFKSILHEYYSNKKKFLNIYEGVVETLQALKSRKVLIVAFTESYVFFTKYRIKHLNLDGLIDFTYSPQGSDLPQSVYKYYTDEFWEPINTQIRSLPNNTRKPNAGILNQIIEDFNADKSKAIYIGDKLDRDVYMAQQAGVTSIHAEYGHVIDSNPYQLLREVTHWTDEDVKREKDFKNQKKDINEADYVINRFDDLLNLFHYIPFN